ncbi:MAG: hypothetical protein LBL44_03010 [Treponema sp.]|jgi:hypothetical protein|nr:hypothetical protein [Treponema sp.]
MGNASDNVKKGMGDALPITALTTAGATIGSAFMPGIGTAIGAGIGAVVGVGATIIKYAGGKTDKPKS